MIESVDGRSFAAVDRFDTVAGLALDLNAARVFKVGAYAAGKYFIRVQNSPTGWMFKGATLDGRDVSDTPLDLDRDVLDAPLDLRQGAGDAVLTLTDQVSEVAGTVTDRLGNPAAAHYVVAFSTERSAWFFNSRRVAGVRPNPQGRYAIRNLPPGTYRIVASADIEQNEWFDPAVLDRLLPAAATITITGDEKKTHDLTIR